ncbi:hypothetical protein AX17_005894 [Amanita inopinata Kibby_2008]|nr:hypothetical protein AX17_005894 [Amanita inopinata Kibby_2008]
MAQAFSTQWIKVSEPCPHVYHVQLARSPVNAFSTEFWKEYGTVFDRLNKQGQDVRAVVLSSVFPKIFSAGLDLNDGLPLGGKSDTARATLALRKDIVEFQEAIGTPERCSFPVIAACHGHVVGLGIDLISACDIRYTASHVSFSIKEVDVGLAPDIGTLAFLPKITGNLSLVRELTYTARPFGADEAERLGLVSRVVQGGREEVIAAALELARVIASKSPVAVACSKHLITHARDHTVQENLGYTAVVNSSQIMTDDISKNLQALKSKSTPTFAALNIPPKL